MSREHLGRYEIVGKLGQGAMGVVYKARDPLIERIVAIKTVSLGGLTRAESEAYEERFHREAKSAGCLNHPNIVTIHDVGRSGDLAYIAMEFLEGRSLREILDSGVVLPTGKVVKIAGQIAKGLAYAHHNGVVHRDIKPANIMVLKNGTVKITDFGVALLPAGSLTVAGTAFGSPKYMSPEQVVGRQVDGRSDIFSLGAVMYETLTGIPPFAGDDLNAILYKVINETPPAPSSRNRKVTPEIDAIVAKAMAKHPDDRYQSVKELISDLRDCRQPEQPSDVALVPRTLERRARPRAAGDATVKIEVSAADVLPRHARVALPDRLPARPAPRLRRLSLYAVPALLLVLAAGWIGIQRAAAKREPAPEKLAVVVSEAPPKSETSPPAPVSKAPPVSASPAPSPSAEPAAPAPRPTGRVTFAVAPWGEIYVDGRKRGVSPPMTELRLAAGRHTIEIRNATFPPHQETVVLGPRASVRIKHKFK